MHNNILLINGLLIDGTGNLEKSNAMIEIEEGKIKSIHSNKDSSRLNKDNYTQVIDLRGLTVLPGFVNTHVHSGFKFLNGKPLRDFHEEYLEACIKEGVTTIRDEGMLSDDTIETVIEKRKELIERKNYPRIITTGKFFSAPNGYGGMQPIEVTSLEDVKFKVNELLNKGIDMVKTVLEDGLDPSTIGLPKLSDDLLNAICEEAHKRGVKVSAHVTQAHNLEG